MKKLLLIVSLLSVNGAFCMERTASELKGCYAQVVIPNEELRSKVASFLSISTAVSGSFLGMGVMRLLLPQAILTRTIVGGFLGFIPVLHSSLLRPKILELVKRPDFDCAFISFSKPVIHKA